MEDKFWDLRVDKINLFCPKESGASIEWAKPLMYE